MTVQYAAIIAGGQSRRMGTPKALIPLLGKPLIAHVADALRHLFVDIVVVSQNADYAVAAGADAVPDIHPGKGPVAGIHTALSHFQAPTFCVACDMPFLHRGFISFMCRQAGDWDALLPRRNGRAEPLHAVYKHSCRQPFEAELAADRVRPVVEVLESLRVHYVEEAVAASFDPELAMLENWNTVEDVHFGLPRFRRLLKSPQS